jgi:hypothetical protein
MTEHEIAFWTLVLTAAAVLIAGAGIYFAIRTLQVAVRTLQDGAEISRAQFWVTIRGVLANYDDVHAKLRPGGPWAPPELERFAKIGPATAEEWARVELLMGLFEYCETLLTRGMLAQRDFEKAYAYRIDNLLHNAPIVREKLIVRASDWKDFIRLCGRFKVAIPSERELPKTDSADAR